MARTTSITIGEQLNNFINNRIKSGRYNSASEVVRTALRLLEQQEYKIEALRSAIMDGQNSGTSNLTLKEIADKKKKELSNV